MKASAGVYIFAASLLWDSGHSLSAFNKEKGLCQLPYIVSWQSVDNEAGDVHSVYEQN